jgi:hypothetical protein
MLPTSGAGYCMVPANTFVIAWIDDVSVTPSAVRDVETRAARTRSRPSWLLGSATLSWLSMLVEIKNGSSSGRSTYVGATPGENPGSSELGVTPYSRCCESVPPRLPSIRSSRCATCAGLLGGMQLAPGHAPIEYVRSTLVPDCQAGSVIGAASVFAARSMWASANPDSDDCFWVRAANSPRRIQSLLLACGAAVGAVSGLACIAWRYVYTPPLFCSMLAASRS